MSGLLRLLCPGRPEDEAHAGELIISITSIICKCTMNICIHIYMCIYTHVIVCVYIYIYICIHIT